MPNLIKPFGVLAGIFNLANEIVLVQMSNLFSSKGILRLLFLVQHLK